MRQGFLPFLLPEPIWGRDGGIQAPDGENQTGVCEEPATPELVKTHRVIPYTPHHVIPSQY